MPLPPHMKAVLLPGHGQDYQVQQELQDYATPRIQDSYDVIVKVAVASFCHTDGMVQVGVFGTRAPIIPGHEGAGTIVPTGSQAELDGWQVGQKVMCGLSVGQCGTCEDCKGPEDQTHYCRTKKGALGILDDGFMAEYVHCDSRACLKLPSDVDFLNAAPLTCAGRTIWRSIKLARDAPYANERLGLVGSGGGLGHIGVQIPKALETKVVAIDAREEGLVLSRQLGSDVVIDARGAKESIVKKVLDATGGILCGSTVNLADHVTSAALACAMTRQHGTVIQVAQPATVEVPFTELVIRDIRTRGSMMASQGESQELLDFVSRHEVSVRMNAFFGLD